MPYFKHPQLKRWRNTHPKNSAYICLGGVSIRKSDPILRKLANIERRFPNHAERNALENALYKFIMRKRKAKKSR